MPTVKGKVQEAKGKVIEKKTKTQKAAQEATEKAIDKVADKTTRKVEEQIRNRQAKKLGYQTPDDGDLLANNDPTKKDKVKGAVLPVAQGVGNVATGVAKTSLKPSTVAKSVFEDGIGDSIRVIANDVAQEQFDATIFKGKRDTRIIKRISELKYNNIKENLEEVKKVLQECCPKQKLDLRFTDNAAFERMAVSQIKEEKESENKENVGTLKEGKHVVDKKIEKVRQSNKLPNRLKKPKEVKVGILEGIKEEKDIPVYDSSVYSKLSSIEKIVRGILTNPQKQSSLFMSVLDKIVNRDTNLKDTKIFTNEERNIIRDFNLLYSETLPTKSEFKLFDVLRLYMGYYIGSESGAIDTVSADNNLNTILEFYIPKLCLLINNWYGTGVTESEIKDALLHQATSPAAGGIHTSIKYKITPDVLRERLFILLGFYRGNKMKQTKKTKPKKKKPKKKQYKKKKTKMR
jgi:hypothetical protein